MDILILSASSTVLLRNWVFMASFFWSIDLFRKRMIMITISAAPTAAPTAIPMMAPVESPPLPEDPGVVVPPVPAPVVVQTDVVVSVTDKVELPTVGVAVVRSHAELGYDGVT